MSCKGCKERGAAIQKVLQRWLGFDNFYKALKYWVDSRVSESETAINETNAKVRALMGAGADIESALSTLDDSNSKLHAEHLERVEALREALTVSRRESWELKDLVTQQGREIAEQAQSINKLEHPGFNPIG